MENWSKRWERFQALKDLIETPYLVGGILAMIVTWLVGIIAGAWTFFHRLPALERGIAYVIVLVIVLLIGRWLYRTLSQRISRKTLFLVLGVAVPAMIAGAYWLNKDYISSIVGDLREARTSHFAVELDSHRILLIGGRIGGGKLKTTEIFDPNTLTVTSGYSSGLSILEYQGAAIWLKGEEKVFVFDGSQAELYDPSKDRFSSVSNFPSSSFGSYSTATLLQDGRVLLVGGTNARKKTEVYDPRTGTFSAASDLIKEREVHTVTWLAGTQVLITGGARGNEAEIFDTQQGSQLTGEMRQPRGFHRAIRLNSGNVFVVGGMDGRRVLKSTEVYSVPEGKFMAGPDMAILRYGHTATLLPDGCVVVIGGVPTVDGVEQPTCIVEKTCPDGDENVAKHFWAIGKIREARAFHTATLWGSRKIVIAGGNKNSLQDPKNTLTSIEIVKVD